MFLANGPALMTRFAVSSSAASAALGLLVASPLAFADPLDDGLGQQ